MATAHRSSVSNAGSANKIRMSGLHKIHLLEDEISRESHSLREMSAWKSNHHWSEEIFRVPVIIIPMSLLSHFESGLIPVTIMAIYGMQGMLEHSWTGINLGKLRYVVADNRYHSIHHSLEKRHWNLNWFLLASPGHGVSNVLFP